MRAHKTHKRLWSILTVLFLALAVASVCLAGSFENRSQVLSSTGISTGLQNNVLAYDEQRDMLFVGTYGNLLVAFKDGRPAWTFEAKGTFVRLVPRPELGLIYAGNADNHVYVIDIETGAVQSEINAGRRILDIDVSGDGQLVLVSAGTKGMRITQNVTVYTPQGEQVASAQYRTQCKGVAFTQDDSGVLLINDRGEIQKTDFEGNLLGQIVTNFEQISVRDAGEGRHISLGADGTYTLFDDDMQVLRSGKPALEAGDVPSAVGVSGDGQLVFVGTKERYMYVLDEQDRQIYSARLDNTLSDFLAVGDQVYVTGRGDFLLIANAAALAGDAALGDLAAALRRLTPLLAALAALCLLLAIPRGNDLARRFVRALVRHRVAYGLLLPIFALLIWFNYVPAVLAFTRAFTDWSKTNYQSAQISFVGLDNFRTMFTEDYFLRGISNLGLIVAMNFLKVLTVPLVLAWMVSMMGSDRKKYIYRFLLVLPIVVPGVVSALLWKQIYDPQIGLINQLLGKLGLSHLQRVWLGNEHTAIWAIIFMGFPFVNAMAFLVYYGGFTNIDRSVLESAHIDGASRGRIFRSVQLPMIGPQVKLMLTLTFISSMQDFYPIYLLTGGGPGTSTYVPSLEIYLNATTFGRYGYACALGMLMFLFIMIGTLINLRLQREGSALKGGA